MTNADQEKQVRDSIEHVADRAATNAVRETLTALGIDVSNPMKSQEEFQALRALARIMKDEGIAEDMQFIRNLRHASETIKDTTWRTAIRIFVTALIGAVVIGTRDMWIQHLPWK